MLDGFSFLFVWAAQRANATLAQANGLGKRCDAMRPEGPRYGIGCRFGSAAFQAAIGKWVIGLDSGRWPGLREGGLLALFGRGLTGGGDGG